MSQREKRSRGAVEKRRAVLENLKKARSGLTRTELHELKEEDDVYDVVDQEDYEKLVESRRQMDDFVVDDDNLGYYDDGEEFVGVVDELKAAEAEVDLAEKSPSKKRHRKSSLTKDESGGQKNTMFSFVKPGLSNTQAATAHHAAISGPGRDLDLDNLLKTLDSKNSAAGPARGSRGYGFLSHSRPLQQSLVPTVTKSNQSFVKTEHSAPSGYYEDSYDQQTGHDDITQSDHYDLGGDMDMMASGSAGQESFASPSLEPEGEIARVKDEPNVVPISLTSTTKKLQLPAPKAKPAAADLSSGLKPLPSPAEDLMVMSQIGGDVGGEQEGLSAPASAAAHSLDASWWIMKSEDEAESTEEYVNMFWLDASEANGVIYLFGKVPITETGGRKYFVSCCVAVHGNDRNLFVLPKSTGETHADGKSVRAPLQEVYADLTRLLVPDIVPRAQGQSFRCKSVRRKYAFEHGDVPRGEESYMKVVYSAKYGVPSAVDCSGYRSIERIFGASSSVLELFLLKRELRGPGWITIRNPRVMPSSMSWCRLEIGIENPKFVKKMSSSDPLAVPPITAMSISMKTVVNPTTHTHEIVMLSALTHSKVDMDADSDLHPSTMRRFTIVRPLGNTCGASNGYATAFPPNFAADVAGTKGLVLSVGNERALLSMFFSKLLREDPDMLVAHNLFGFEFDVILARAIANKLSTWSQIGRLRKSRVPKSVSDKDVAAGRLLCDTYKAAKEFLRETTYSLTHLAQAQLGFERAEIDPVDVPKYFGNSADILNLAMHTASDAFLVQRLLFKLQVVPLTKQLTNLSGNLWSRTLRGARAERIEYLLLHEFHSNKYILPEKKAFENAEKSAKHPAGGDDDDDEYHGNVVGGNARKRAKAAYAGGLVLEPKKGLYDTFILLLDFNSLYPSLIQEYNLCFTTVDWTKYMGSSVASADKAGGKGSSAKAAADVDDDEEDGEPDDGAGAGTSGPELPPIPDSGAPPGVLPRVIKTLVDRRRQVKDLLKNARDPTLKQQYDIRQKALKLTANSMYGCLGFSFSRFYARPIAALVTSKGREALQRTVAQAQNMQLDVIYGDTDSVMINTNSTDLAMVKQIGLKVKQEVNKLYKSLELDIDGIFKSMLLLKKKKYAAVTIKEVDGGIILEKELKGLDLVRRDWCPLSKETGKFVVDQILSCKPREEIVMAIHEYMNDLATNVRNGNVDLTQFIVTKGLNKSPKDYPDCKGQPHLQVALRMLKLNRPVNIGDHIPYVICNETEIPQDVTDGGVAEIKAVEGNGSEHPIATKKSSPAERAFHPDEIARANGRLTVDYEWYLTQQILPPVSRLCEPIEGTSTALLSMQLGLDASKYSRVSAQGNDAADFGFTPACMLDDAERFKDCARLMCKCFSCNQLSPFPGVVDMRTRNNGGVCPSCGAERWGLTSANDLYCHIFNQVTLLMRKCLEVYYTYELICDDPVCGSKTRQQSVIKSMCTTCRGVARQVYSDKQLHNQVQYLQSLFDASRNLPETTPPEERLARAEAIRNMPDIVKEVFRVLNIQMKYVVDCNAYHWIRPSLWSTVWGKSS